MRNYRITIRTLKVLRRFYERLGWKDKVSDVDRAFEETLKAEEASHTSPIPRITEIKNRYI
jgi:hypothetical protein